MNGIILKGGVWTKQEIRLITEVKRRPILYEIDESAGSEIEYAKSWNEVSLELGLPVTTCKSQWDKIIQDFDEHINKPKNNDQTVSFSKYLDGTLDFLDTEVEFMSVDHESSNLNEEITDNGEKIETSDFIEQLESNSSSQSEINIVSAHKKVDIRNTDKEYVLVDDSMTSSNKIITENPCMFTKLMLKKVNYSEKSNKKRKLKNPLLIKNKNRPKRISKKKVVQDKTSHDKAHGLQFIPIAASNDTSLKKVIQNNSNKTSNHGREEESSIKEKSDDNCNETDIEKQLESIRQGILSEIAKSQKSNINDGAMNQRKPDNQSKNMKEYVLVDTKNTGVSDVIAKQYNMFHMKLKPVNTKSRKRNKKLKNVSNKTSAPENVRDVSVEDLTEEKSDSNENNLQLADIREVELSSIESNHKSSNIDSKMSVKEVSVSNVFKQNILADSSEPPNSTSLTHFNDSVKTGMNQSNYGSVGTIIPEIGDIENALPSSSILKSGLLSTISDTDNLSSEQIVNNVSVPNFTYPPVVYVARNAENRSISITPYIIVDELNTTENVSTDKTLPDSKNHDRISTNIVNSIDLIDIDKDDCSKDQPRFSEIEGDQEDVDDDDLSESDNDVKKKKMDSILGVNVEESNMNVFFDQLAEYVTCTYPVEKQLDIRSKICALVTIAEMEERLQS